MAMPPTVGFWLYSSGYWISTCEPPCSPTMDCCIAPKSRDVMGSEVCVLCTGFMLIACKTWQLIHMACTPRHPASVPQD